MQIEGLHLFMESVTRPVLEETLQDSGSLIAWYREYHKERANKEERGHDKLYERYETYWFLTEKNLINMQIAPNNIRVRSFTRQSISSIERSYEIISDLGKEHSQIQQIKLKINGVENELNLFRPKENEFAQQFSQFAKSLSRW
ncbi:hypothetical protein [Syntrophomonas palmitatica]|uniref:hypothetical protein n=1 Tax=Syntrophomonas palmitatica TaxID=402877 RepID=UPI0006D124CE|nr:hypothetical protein [Syntrophomonas palmitatica]